MRPDEEANKSEINRDKRFRSNVSKGVGAAGTLAGGAITARIMPFLSELIPSDLAMKGLSRISPKLGDFLRKGQSMGLKIKEGLRYVKEEIQPKEKTKDSRNIIEQYSPELHQFILDQIQQGRSHIEAGALAQLESKGSKGFKSVIDKITKDHKAPWSAILQTVYGQGQEAAQQAQKIQPTQQQGGQGQQALMAILQKLQQARGA